MVWGGGGGGGGGASGWMVWVGGSSSGCSSRCSVSSSMADSMLRKYAAGRPPRCYWAGDTLDMLKSGIRSAGIAVREKKSSPHSRLNVGTVPEAWEKRRSRSTGLSFQRKLLTAAVISPPSTR